MIIGKPGKSDTVISLQLDCRAPRPKVFETWTQPVWLKKWFMAEERFRCTVAEADLRVGGKFKLGMAVPGAEQATVFTGSYEVVKPAEALVYSWSGGEGTHQTLVTTLFSDRDQGSRVDFTHGVFLTGEARAQHEQGWMLCLVNFGRLVDG